MLQRPLTEKQQEALDYLKEYVGEEGDFPTFREMADDLGYKSPHSVTLLMRALVRKGYLVNDNGQYDFAEETLYLGPGRKREIYYLFEELLQEYRRLLIGAGVSKQVAQDQSKWYMAELESLLEEGE